MMPRKADCQPEVRGKILDFPSSRPDEHALKYCLAYLHAFYLARPAQADRLSVDAKQRSYILGGAGPKPKPLIIALHGGGGSARQFRRQSTLGTEVLPKGFTVVWPDAIGGNWNAGRLNRRRHLVHDEND
jgi:poly(3-hydroxybutyrate) depolymerase